MDEGMTKARLLETLETRRAAWDAALAEVPESAMTEPGVAGEWSVKDLVVHLTYYERWYADRLHERLRGEAYQYTEADTLPFNERNEIVFQQNRDRPLAEVLADSRQAFERLLVGVQAHAEAFLIEPQQLEGVPQPITLWKMLQGDVYEHYGEHIPTIQEWLAAH